VLASSPSPRTSAERMMTGTRNENSVLFSLKNLQALATGSGSNGPAAAPPTNDRPGFAGGEGSGLIDIRALATATGVGESRESSGHSLGHKDELLSIGSQGGAFGTLGSPMLASGGDDSDSHKKTIIWAVVAGVGLVSVAAVAAAYILRTPPAPAAAPVAIAPVAAPAPVAQPAVPVPPTAAERPSEGELAARQAGAQLERGREPDEGSSAHSATTHSRKHGAAEGNGAKSAASNATEAAAQVEPKKAPPKSSGPRSIDDLLDNALSGSSSSKAAHAGVEPTAPKSDLAEIPSRDQVLSAMNGVKPAV
jgi:hypothetical protein